VHIVGESDCDGATDVNVRLARCWIFVIALAMPWSASAAIGPEGDIDVIRVGVLALRGANTASRRWHETVDYLAQRFAPTPVSMVSLDFDEIRSAVQGQHIDFLLANPAYYIQLEYGYGVSRIATLQNFSSRGPVTVFGSVVLRRASRADLGHLKDLAGQRIGAVDGASLGGYLMVRRELLRHGVDLAHVRPPVDFLGTHDAVVKAVLDGVIDAGIVRTDTVENMALEGKISLSDLVAVEGHRDPDFPLLHSTRLYPEWPMAALPHVPISLRKDMARALFDIAPESDMARSGRYVGWTVPESYSSVHQLARELEIAPYDVMPTLRQLVKQHPVSFGLAMMLGTTLLIYAGTVRYQNKRLTETSAALLRTQTQRERTHEELIRKRADLDVSEHRFFRLAGIAKDGIALLDDEGKVRFANPSACRILGRSRSEVIGRTLGEDLIPALPPRTGSSRSTDRGRAGQGGTQSVELQRTDGKQVTLELSFSALDEGGRVFTICIFRDITERQLIEQALGKSRENFRSIVDKNRSGILLLDRNGTVMFSNRAASRMLNRSREELENTVFGIPASSSGARTEMNVVRRDGRPGVVEMQPTQTVWNGESAYLVMMHDVTAYREAEAKITEMAYTDHLTGLPNRPRLQQELYRAVKRAVRASSRFALLYLDLDRFKEVNDTLGHVVGDALLVAVANRLRACVRDTDLVARMGGDEFTILLENIDSIESAEQVGLKVSEALREPFDVGGNELYIGASIGCSLYPDSSSQPGEMLKQADTAMYKAKRSRLDYVLFSPDLAEVVEHNVKLLRELRKALADRQFRLYYQPQIDLENLALIGFEALLRWHHPVDGIVMPGTFMPVLEREGLIVDVGHWVIEEACRQLAAWADDGWFLDVPVAINVSPVQLEHDDVAAFVEGALASHRLSANRLKVEITETSLIADSGRVTRHLKALERLGLDLLLDDFGTGYSSLSLLRRIRLTTIKIDQSFVRDLEHDPADCALTDAVITMASGMHVSSLAEGVETWAQLDILRRMGCDYAQGYLFGRPEPADRLAEIDVVQRYLNRRSGP
jgi:diguanylate cyclase (GGDEF)-like protein/PAS domain S-box-containing protein